MSFLKNAKRRPDPFPAKAGNAKLAQSFAATHGPDGYGLLRVLGFKSYMAPMPDAPELFNGGLDLSFAAATQRENEVVAALLELEHCFVTLFKGGKPKRYRNAEEVLARLGALCKHYNIGWVKLYGIPAAWQKSLNIMGKCQIGVDIQSADR